MDDDLIDSSQLSLTRRSLLPGTGFFYPDSLDEERAEERVAEAVEGAEAVVIADGDADGLGCVALIREAYDAALEVGAFETAIAERLAEAGVDGYEVAEPDAEAAALDGKGEAEGAAADEDRPVPEDVADEESPVALVRSGPYDLDRSLERVAEHLEPDADVFVCDLCPDDYDEIAEALEALVGRASRVRWFDHHQWDDDVATAVRAAGVDLVVGDSEEECTTDVALRSLDHEFSGRLAELAVVTRDHDLWIKADSRSDDLADYSHWSGAEEYVTVVGAYGPDLPPAVLDYVAHRREEKQRLIEKAVDRAETKTVGPWTVAVTYGRCSQNEVAERLREQGADAAVIVKPSGSASIRGSENFELAHRVARQVDGGGHPKAAGCKPDIYDDMMDYAAHWTSRGETTKRVILQAFERVAEAVADEDEGVETDL
ncbi:MAG: DHH family phosphoesterase [Haloferacaceae archaeon]